MQEREHFSRKCAFSEGWEVSCVCGAKKDDGGSMIECEECKVCACTALQADVIRPSRMVHAKMRMHCSCIPCLTQQIAMTRQPACCP